MRVLITWMQYTKELFTRYTVSYAEPCLGVCCLPFWFWFWPPTLERLRLLFFFCPPWASGVLLTPGPSPTPVVELECFSFFLRLRLVSPWDPDFFSSITGVTSCDLALYFNARNTDAAPRRHIITMTTTTVTAVFDPAASSFVSVEWEENI